MNLISYAKIILSNFLVVKSTLLFMYSLSTMFLHNVKVSYYYEFLFHFKSIVLPICKVDFTVLAIYKKKNHLLIITVIYRDEKSF